MTRDEREMSMRCPSVFEIVVTEWSDTWNQFVEAHYSYRDHREAVREFNRIAVGDELPEVQLFYLGNPGCYLHRHILMRDKRIAYWDGMMTKIERRHIYDYV